MVNFRNKNVVFGENLKKFFRLQSFCTSLTQAEWIVEGKSHRFVKLAQRCVNWADSRNANFEKCGSYDPTLPNGGPDPNYVPQPPRNYVANWDTGRVSFDDMFQNDRKRRSDDCSDFDGKF